jgi:DNA polymerase I-like protein with 3'-5' exonuclease and polymerase domains
VHKKIKELCILLPVHDELVFEAENYYLKYLPDVVKKTKDMMINYPQITVPLNTDTSISKTTWDKKETYESE